MPTTDVDAIFARFQQQGDPADLARVFDLLAPQLLLIAQHLSRSGVSAEDLVQDTFVRAIETIEKFDPNRRCLPWLLGILSFEAQNARRRAARFPDPRRLPKQAAPIPSDIAEAEEFQAVLAKTVDELPPNYRDVMNLRLVHGLTPTEIAHALGRPPETVKTQLRRGRDLLQAALPASFTAMLALVLLPSASLLAIRNHILEFAQQKLVPLSASRNHDDVLTSSTKKFLASQPLIVASLLITAAAAVLWFSLGLGTDDSPPPISYTRTEVPERGPDEQRRSNIPVPTTKKPDSIAQHQVRALFHGRIQRPNGGPASQLSVAIFRFAPDVLTATPDRYDPSPLSDGSTVIGTATDRVLAGTAITDKQGAFEIEGQWPESLFVVTWNRQVKLVTETPTPEHAINLGTLQLNPGTSLAGRIIDANGKSASNARVRFTSLSSSFLRSYPVQDLLDAHQIIYSEPARTLEDVTTFWNTLLNLEQKPVSDCVLVRPRFLDQIEALWPFFETTTDGSGRFEIDGLPRGKVSLVVSYPGHRTLVRGEIETDPIITRELGSYQLEPGHSVSGRIFDAQGSTLAGAEVAFASPGANGSPYHFTKGSILTDDRGKFDIGGLDDTRGYLAFRRSPGDAWTQLYIQNTEEYLAARLLPTHRLSFALKGNTGHNISSAGITLVPGKQSLDLAYRGLLQALDLTGRVTFDEEGTATLEDIPPGEYTLLISTNGHKTYATELDLTANTQDSLLLDPAGRYEVTVLGANHEPVAGAEVYALGTRSRSMVLAGITLHAGTTDAEGKVFVEGLAGKEIVLTAQHPAHGIGHVTALLNPDAAFQVRLSKPGRITGTLTQIEPSEWRDWAVSMRPLPQPYPDVTALPAATVFAPADAKLSFRQLGLDSTEYELRAIHSFTNLQSTAELTMRLLRLNPGTPTRRSHATRGQAIEVPASFATALLTPDEEPDEPESPPPELSLTGIVYQHNGSLAAKTEVKLYAKTSTPGIAKSPAAKPHLAFSDEKGRFTFDDVEAGDYSLVLRGAGPGRKTQALSIPATDRQPLTITLTSGVFISGQLQDPGRLKSIQFILQDSFGNWLNFEPTQVPIRPNGTFTKPIILPAGRYKITPGGASVAKAYGYTEYLTVGDRDLLGIIVPRLVARRRPPGGVIVRRPGSLPAGRAPKGKGKKRH